eukprot:m.183513 g.183513  ORF g.183513 m.183513 type:complete len:81 (-) comp25510_c0_seq1:1348-1590(-)
MTREQSMLGVAELKILDLMSFYTCTELSFASTKTNTKQEGPSTRTHTSPGQNHHDQKKKKRKERKKESFLNLFTHDPRSA